jgi:hypothetical protein
VFAKVFYEYRGFYGDDLKVARLEQFIEKSGKTSAFREKFKEINGSIICRELLAGIPHSINGTPEKRTDDYYKKRPCAELVEIAAGLISEHVFENLNL